MAEFEGELSESSKSSEDKDELGGATGAFATLLADTNNIDRTSDTHFTLVASLLAQTTPCYTSGNSKYTRKRPQFHLTCLLTYRL